MDYELQYENDLVKVARAILAPGEKIGLHADLLPTVVISPNGGVITRLEQDGSETHVHFPKDVPVLREINPALHESFNASSDPLELILISFKTEKAFLPFTTVETGTSTYIRPRLSKSPSPSRRLLW